MIEYEKRAMIEAEDKYTFRQSTHLLQEAFKFHESLAENGDMHFKK